MAFDGFPTLNWHQDRTGRPALLRDVLGRRRGTLPRRANPSIGQARPSGGFPCELPRSQPSCSSARQRRARRARTIEAFIPITAARTSRPPAATSTRPLGGRARRSPPSPNPLRISPLAQPPDCFTSPAEKPSVARLVPSPDQPPAATSTNFARRPIMAWAATPAVAWTASAMSWRSPCRTASHAGSL